MSDVPKLGTTDKSIKSSEPWSAATTCTHGGAALFNLDKELATQRDTSIAASKVVVSRNKAVPRGIPLVTALQGFLSDAPRLQTVAEQRP